MPALLRKLPREAARRLELLRSLKRYNLEREIYEVYTDFLRRNDEIGMSDLDLQGPTSFHSRMDAIRPKEPYLQADPPPRDPSFHERDPFLTEGLCF